MKCPVCGGSIKGGSTNLPIEMKSGLLYVKQVPADICNQCGESFISDDVAENLEKIVAKAEKQKIEVEIISYKDAA